MVALLRLLKHTLWGPPADFSSIGQISHWDNSESTVVAGVPSVSVAVLVVAGMAVVVPAVSEPNGGRVGGYYLPTYISSRWELFQLKGLACPPLETGRERGQRTRSCRRDQR